MLTNLMKIASEFFDVAPQKQDELRTLFDAVSVDTFVVDT